MADEKTIPAFAGIAQLKPAAAGEHRDGVERVQLFLSRFGYLEEGQFEADTIDDQTSAALAKYQERLGLRPTGEFDAATQESMTASRCGLPDVNDGIDFATTCRWPKPETTARVAGEWVDR